MNTSVFFVCSLIARCKESSGGCHTFIIPNELPSILSIIYSNIPPVKVGIDTRFGYGFRIGPHADFQTLIEIGPQTNTNPISTNGTVAKRQSTLNRIQRLYNDPLKKENVKAEQKNSLKGKKTDKTLVGKIEFKKVPGIDDINEQKTKILKNTKISSTESTPTKFQLLS